MIALEHVAFSYPGGLPVLADVSLSFAPGKLTALLGPNGAGKSTLLRCILGTLTPQTGSILLNGQDLAQKTQQDRAALVSYVPQQGAVPPDMTVGDFVLMGTIRTLSVFALPGKRQRQSAENALEGMRLQALKNRKMGQISGGERQRALIARALAQETPVLLMDEPISSLDWGYQKRLMDTARALADGGKTVIISIHQPQWALQYADEAALLSRGRVEAFGPAGGVLTADRLQKLYGVEIQIYEMDGKKIIG